MQFANDPNDRWNEVQEAIDHLRATVFSALGEDESKEAFKNLCNAVFHVQIEWNEYQTEPMVKPWPELQSALTKAALEDGTQQTSTVTRSAREDFRSPGMSKRRC